MKKLSLILVAIVTIFLFLGIFLFKTDTIPVAAKKILSKKQVSRPYIIYMPSRQNNLLEPSIAEISGDKNIEEKVIESLINSSREFFKENTKIKSIVLEKNLAKVNLSKNFKDDASIDDERYNLTLMAVVNTLTEFNHIDEVQIFSGKEKMSFKSIDKFKRDTSYINLQKYDSPKKVVHDQMKFEQSGKLLEAYLLMSDLHSENRKLFYEYVSEMEEIKDLGFLNSKFKIVSWRENEKEAIITVEFSNLSSNGEVLEPSRVDVRCINISGSWKVDWEPKNL